MGDDVSKDYWSGATWVYHATVTNDGATSGNHVYVVSPGVGQEMEVLYGRLFNGDGSARTAFANTRNAGGDVLTTYLATISLGVQGHYPFPQIDESTTGGSSLGPTRKILSGTMDITFNVNSIAINQDTAFSIVARIRGGLPTVTITSPAGATETVDENRTY